MKRCLFVCVFDVELYNVVYLRWYTNYFIEHIASRFVFSVFTYFVCYFDVIVSSKIIVTVVTLGHSWTQIIY